MNLKFVKKLVSVLLLVAMLIPAAAFAEESESEWWNILLLGGDSRDINSYDRTDTMIILSVNRETNEMKMTSIMRDTWVKLTSSKSGKINAANVYGGPELAVQVVNESFGTDIEDYILVNMKNLVELIDMVGGVDIEVNASEQKWTNEYAQDYLKSIADYDGETQLNANGMVHLNGLLAVAYMRNRYTDSDYGRVMRQQKVLLAVAERAQNMEVDELMALADDVSERVMTNMDVDQMKQIATVGLVTEVESVGQYRVPVDGTFDSGTFSGTWMIRPNLEKNQQLLHDFIYGEND